MGRLEIQIHHGHGHGPEGWGAVIALIAFVVLAAAGGVGHKALTGAARDVLTAVEVAAWVVGGLVATAAAVLVVLALARIRAALRRPRDGRPPVITLTPHRGYDAMRDGDDRPALEAPRRRLGDITSHVSARRFADIIPPDDHRHRS
jgi:hypothetical protein